jgi:hypothetical protein
MEANWGTIYVCMEMSQQNPLYSYHILIKTFLVRNNQKVKMADRNGSGHAQFSPESFN